MQDLFRGSTQISGEAMITNYSVAITTFSIRFDKYLKPLLTEICKQRPDAEKIVYANGPHNKRFDENYRRNIGLFCSVSPRTFLITNPSFRGLSKIWNTCINSSEGDYILILNDDVTITEGFFDEFERMLDHNSRELRSSFKLNHSFSHFCVHRPDMFRVGYFDERLIGNGEEDGDWQWRWETARNQKFPVYTTNKIINHVEVEMSSLGYAGMNLTTGQKPVPKFNPNWMFTEKYELDPSKFVSGRATNTAMFDRPAQIKIGADTPDFYPAEKWYREKRNEL